MQSPIKIHLINTFRSAIGGSELLTVDLYRLLRDSATVQMWHRGKADPLLTETYPVRQIHPSRLEFPRRGTFVFVGAYFRLRSWFLLARPQRVIIIHNTNEPVRLNKLIARAQRFSGLAAEIVYASGRLAKMTTHSGVVQISPIDLERFSPGPRREPTAVFRVGRISRDIEAKHGEDDPALYRRLVEQGCEVEILGGTCLADKLRGTPVQLKPPRPHGADSFMRTLDCFVYRTHRDLFEAWGRVVCEAMACGLPVVCHRRGGYTELIEDGKTGFLFDDNEQALAIILMLKHDPPLRRQIGTAARHAMQERFGAGFRRELVAFYLGGGE